MPVYCPGPGLASKDDRLRVSGDGEVAYASHSGEKLLAVGFVLVEADSHPPCAEGVFQRDLALPLVSGLSQRDFAVFGQSLPAVLRHVTDRAGWLARSLAPPID